MALGLEAVGALGFPGVLSLAEESKVALSDDDDSLALPDDDADSFFLLESGLGGGGARIVGARLVEGLSLASMNG